MGKRFKNIAISMSCFLSFSPEETLSLGINFGKRLIPGDVVCFCGDLAAGKTTFIKGLAMGAADWNPDAVQSPTFNYLHIYEGVTCIYHFDLYRIRGMDDFLSMGFDEYFREDGICCIEWSERITSHKRFHSIDHWTVHLLDEGEGTRKIIIQEPIRAS